MGEVGMRCSPILYRLELSLARRPPTLELRFSHGRYWSKRWLDSAPGKAD